MTPSEIDRELVALYIEETKQPENVCIAFIRAGQEPPPRWRTDDVGFSSAQMNDVLGKYYPSTELGA